MCGIFLLIKSYFKNIPLDLEEVDRLYMELEKRGPDSRNLTLIGNDIIGFNRLAINDTSQQGMQPFVDKNGNYLMCNGEIYNHKALEKKYNISVNSRSDCEFLLTLFRDHGVDTVKEIDGIFAIVAKIGVNYYFIRDRLGVKPLYLHQNDNFMSIASEPLALEFKNVANGYTVELPPSCIVKCGFNFEISYRYYHSIPFVNVDIEEEEVSEKSLNEVVKNVKDLMISSVKKRLLSDRPIGCLLSGGLDSSVISAIVADIYKKNGKKLKTFSVGFEDSTDLKYAKMVAEHIGSEHHELIITPEDALKSIPTVVRNLSTWDITTIRASTPMWMLCNWINENFEEKVLFSGEGSDELFGGYLYFHNAPNDIEFANECRRLLMDIYKYDVLRADRCVSGNSLDMREPFLDIDLLTYYLNLSPKIRKIKDGYEKWVLRKAFEDMLPRDVCWRRKTAFSDGIASSEKPWFRYIQEWTESMIPIGDTNFNTSESYWYYSLFNQYYKNYYPVVKYWLPKWQSVDETKLDPSATTLKIWNKEEH